MAEIGLASAIVGLAGAGVKLSMTLFAVADAVGSAGREARMVATEVSLLSQALRELSRGLKKKTAKRPAIEKTTTQLVRSCRELIVDLRTSLKDIAPEDYHTPKLWAKVKWMFAKDKVDFVRSSLESLKSTLLLLVTSIDFADAEERKKPKEKRDDLKIHMESLMRATESTTCDLIDCVKRQSGDLGDDENPTGDDFNFDEEHGSPRAASSTALAPIVARNGRASHQEGQLVLFSNTQTELVKSGELNILPQQLVYYIATGLARNSQIPEDIDGTDGQESSLSESEDEPIYVKEEESENEYRNTRRTSRAFGSREQQGQSSESIPSTQTRDRNGRVEDPQSREKATASKKSSKKGKPPDEQEKERRRRYHREESSRKKKESESPRDQYKNTSSRVDATNDREDKIKIAKRLAHGQEYIARAKQTAYEDSMKNKANSKPTEKLISKSKPRFRAATAEDGRRAGIPSGYSLRNWDPTQEPIVLLGSVFDANSLGKWIYDWTVFHYGPTAPNSDMAGDLWLLLIQLAGKIQHGERIFPKVQKDEDRELVEEFLESGERLWIRFAKLLKVSEDYMFKAAKKESGHKPITMGEASSLEFVEAFFSRDRELETTEKLMSGMRLWSMRYDAHVEEVASNIR